MFIGISTSSSMRQETDCRPGKFPEHRAVDAVVGQLDQPRIWFINNGNGVGCERCISKIPQPAIPPKIIRNITNGLSRFAWPNRRSYFCIYQILKLLFFWFNVKALTTPYCIHESTTIELFCLVSYRPLMIGCLLIGTHHWPVFSISGKVYISISRGEKTCLAAVQKHRQRGNDDI
ncbi:hypothetical protein BDN70DRAFT_891781 [Pholiota conissans]|uniref:Uncharacterized protein n=1 Tax=Pholiota conissans TaxID=109636 RepID=A0A9P5ZA27_9AGAR|nr:hypothetical protein BDN70DRAFT_891781 [Pholiota conissans]